MLIGRLDPLPAADEQLLDAYAEYLRSARRAETTISGRVSLIRSFARRQHVPLLEATKRHLRADLGRKSIEVATAATLREAFKSFYGFLVDDEYRTDNPSTTLVAIKVPRGLPRPFAMWQVYRMLEEAGAYWRTRAMILLGVYAGLRVSEIAKVHSDDVDLRAMTIRVEGKGGRIDYLPLHPVLAELAPLMGDGYWFPARATRSGHVLGRSVSSLISQVKKRAGILEKGLTPHSLRHTFGTELVRAGVNIRVVQELMRHASLATTQIYTKIVDEDKARGIVLLASRPIPMHSSRRRGLTALPGIAPVSVILQRDDGAEAA